MNKAERDLLEKLYVAEIDAAISGEPLRRIVQSKSKAMLALQALGYARREKVTVKSWPPLMIEGWVLTLAGNAAYCLSCDGDKRRSR